MAKEKRNYSDLELRQKQVSESQEFKEKGGEIRDDNQEGYAKDYDSLKKIKMPLVLAAKEGKTYKSWTVNDVLTALGPTIHRLARSKCNRGRGNIAYDEMVSVGYQAALDALYSDLGLAWFAFYACDKIDAAMDRVSIKQNKRAKKVKSLNEPAGPNGIGELADVIDGQTFQYTTSRCGDYLLNGQIVQKDVKGAKFIPTCCKGERGLYYTPDGCVCERCGGTGMKLMTSRIEVSSVEDIIAEKERQSRIKDLVLVLTDGIPEKQKFVLYARWGIDDGVAKDDPTIAILFQKKFSGEDDIPLGSKNRMQQLYQKALKKVQENSQRLNIDQSIFREMLEDNDETAED